MSEFCSSLARVGFHDTVVCNIRHNLTLLFSSGWYGKAVSTTVFTEPIAEAAFRIASTDLAFSAPCPFYTQHRDPPDADIFLDDDLDKLSEDGQIDDEDEGVVLVSPVSAPLLPSPSLEPYLSSPPFSFDAPPSKFFLYHGASASLLDIISSYALAGPQPSMAHKTGLFKGQAVYYSNSLEFGAFWGSYMDCTGPKRWRKIDSLEDLEVLVHVTQVQKEIFEEEKGGKIFRTFSSDLVEKVHIPSYILVLYP